MNNIRRLSISNATNKNFLNKCNVFNRTPYIKQQESIATNRYDTEYLAFAVYTMETRDRKILKRTKSKNRFAQKIRSGLVVGGGNAEEEREFAVGRICETRGF